MRKKNLLLVALCLLLVVAFAACTAPKEETTATAEPKPTAKATTETVAETTTEAAAEPTPVEIDWPTKAIELVVPANPGGDTDTNARAFAQYLEKELGQSVVVVNMSGGSGGLAFQDLIDSGTEGNKFVFYHSGAAIAEIMGVYEFSVLDKFELLAMPVLDNTNAFVISTKNPNFNDLPSMVAYMKEHPQEVTFATETGSFTHLHVLAFQEAAGVEFNIVDAGTASEKTAALLGQQLDVIGTQYGLIKDYVTSGDFNCIGLLSAERNPNAPEIPTLKEFGYDVVFSKFFYIAANVGTDQAILDKFNAACKVVSENPDYQALAATSLVEPTYMTQEEAEAYYANQVEIYKSFLKDYIN